VFYPLRLGRVDMKGTNISSPRKPILGRDWGKRRDAWNKLAPNEGGKNEGGVPAATSLSNERTTKMLSRSANL